MKGEQQGDHTSTWYSKAVLRPGSSSAAPEVIAWTQRPRADETQDRAAGRDFAAISAASLTQASMIIAYRRWSIRCLDMRIVGMKLPHS
jgi:hypothetical protein